MVMASSLGLQGKKEQASVVTGEIQWMCLTWRVVQHQDRFSRGCDSVPGSDQEEVEQALVWGVL